MLLLRSINCQGATENYIIMTYLENNEILLLTYFKIVIFLWDPVRFLKKSKFLNIYYSNYHLPLKYFELLIVRVNTAIVQVCAVTI